MGGNVLKEVDVDSIGGFLDRLNQQGDFFPQFKFSKKEDKTVCLGRGGFSEVYEMVGATRPEKHYALKVGGFSKHKSTSADFWQSVQIQNRLWQSTHYVVRPLDSCELLVKTDGEGYVTEAVLYHERAPEQWEEAGKCLHLQCILMEKVYPILVKDRYHKVHLFSEELSSMEEVLKLAGQVGQALMVSHEMGILHRDIKLENIFWSPEEGIYKLGDFGIAKYTSGDGAETVIYTEGYGAPEIKKQLTERYSMPADIYSFGITLYLLLNELRFPGSNDHYKARKEAQYNPDYVFPAPRNSIPEIAGVIRKMCSYWPENRYQQVREVVSDIAVIQKSLGMQGANELLKISDVVTETYRGDTEDGEDEEEGEGNREEHEEPQTRKERILMQREIKRIYQLDELKYVVMMILLIIPLCGGMGMDKVWRSYDLKFWLVLSGLAGVGILQGIGERVLRWLGSLALLAYMVYDIWAFSSHQFGIWHILIPVCILAGELGISIATCLGLTLWTVVFVNYGKVLSLVSELDLGWIFLTVWLLLVFQYILTRLAEKGQMNKDGWTPADEVRITVVFWCYDYLYPLMLLAGGVVLLLKNVAGVEIPSLLLQMNLHLVGGVSMLIRVIMAFHEDVAPDWLDWLMKKIKKTDGE